MALRGGRISPARIEEAPVVGPLPLVHAVGVALGDLDGRVAAEAVHYDDLVTDLLERLQARLEVFLLVQCSHDPRQSGLFAPRLGNLVVDRSGHARAPST